MTLRLTLIDELIRKQHHYLEDGDLCYCFGEYTARQGAAYSKTNQLIINLKRGMNVGHSLITTIKRLLLSMLLRCSYQISVILRNTHLFPYHHPNAVQMPLTMTV